jgi:hypothetical protein
MEPIRRDDMPGNVMHRADMPVACDGPREHGLKGQGARIRAGHRGRAATADNQGD